MNHQNSLRRQLDAFRDARDLDLPEMAELARDVSRDASLAAELARSREFDRTVAVRLFDVPVPAGLAERVLAAVAVAELEQATTAAAIEPAIAPPRAGWIRKRWQTALFSRTAMICWATAAAALLLMAGGAYYWRWSHQIFEQEQIAAAVNGWQRDANVSRAERGLPRDFVLPPLPVKPVRYVPFKTQEGWSAVAVDCTTPAGQPATLFIVQSGSYFGGGASSIPQFAASGKKVAAWRRGRLLYVLVEEVAKPRAGAGIFHTGSSPA